MSRADYIKLISSPICKSDTMSAGKESDTPYTKVAKFQERHLVSPPQDRYIGKTPTSFQNDVQSSTGLRRSTEEKKLKIPIKPQAACTKGISDNDSCDEESDEDISDEESDEDRTETAQLLLRFANHTAQGDGDSQVHAPRRRNGGGRPNQTVKNLLKVLNDPEIPNAKWTQKFSEEGGQNFYIINDDDSKNKVMDSVSNKKGSQFRSFLRNLRHYGITQQLMTNKQIEILMFECRCPFHSNCDSDNNKDIKRVIAMQTQSRKRKRNETIERKRTKHSLKV